MEKGFSGNIAKSIYSVKAHDSFDDRFLLIGGYSNHAYSKRRGTADPGPDG